MIGRQSKIKQTPSKMTKNKLMSLRAQDSPKVGLARFEGLGEELIVDHMSTIERSNPLIGLVQEQ